MTIRVEREALLRVISRAPSAPSSTSSSSLLIKPSDDEFVIVEIPNKPFKGDDFFYDDSIPESTDDDQASLCTVSTDSGSSYSSSTSSTERPRVSFAPDLVTDVWTREKTLPEDVSLLYYSSLETQTFRQEYRLERKVLNELSIDPETFPVNDEELSSLVAATTTPPHLSTSCGNSRHRISRVVVVHNDKLETFFNNSADDESLLQQDHHHLPLLDDVVVDDASPSSPDFFDNDSFWSGSLTWY